MLRFAASFTALASLCASAVAGGAPVATYYALEDGAITRHNGDRYNNRPLYCNHMAAHVLAGDMPSVRFVREPYVYGCFMLAMVRGHEARWALDFSERTSRYRAGRMEWVLKDSAFPGIELLMETVPLAKTAGFAVRVRNQGARPGDKLVWVYGAATLKPEATASYSQMSWLLDVVYNPQWLSRGFAADDCKGNTCSVEPHGLFRVQPPAYEAEKKQKMHTVYGRCSAAGAMSVADANSWKSPLALASSKDGDRPIICGSIDIGKSTQDVYWVFEAFIDGENAETANLESPQAAYKAGMARVDGLATQVVTNTPEPRLDAMVASCGHAIDGVFYPPTYVHGAMAWNTPFVGWRSLYGATAYGWHDNVKAQAKHYIDLQEKNDSKRTAHLSPESGYCLQDWDSRFWGKGRVMKDNNPYNMQTQFFDQLIHEWRWTGDPEFEKMLRPALEIHLEWSRECFDPDNDGCYESYINTWPTDTVWYNGGGSVEESAYIFRGELAAAEMAERAGDKSSAKAHLAQAKKIRQGMFKNLWIAESGYFGVYREQGGYKRLHKDAWMYSATLPIDCGIADLQQAAQLLGYTEWGLESVKMPSGGVRRYTSNWVPSIWSVRELYDGDNYDLALMYFRTGLANEGWEILRGNCVDRGFDYVVPGSLGHPGCGCDFTDIFNMFGRAVVEGLFGIMPDYPNGRVRFAPQFPPDWDHASIKTPDMSLSFKRTGNTDVYTIGLTKTAAMHIRLPVRALGVTSVKLDGKPVCYKTEPGFGQSLVIVDAAKCRNARVAVTVNKPIAYSSAVILTGNCGDKIKLHAKQGRITSISDPEAALTEEKIADSVATAALSSSAGHHTVIANVRVGDLDQRQLFRIDTRDPAAEARKAAKTVNEVPSDVEWVCKDIKASFNGDIRAIFKQQYLSPRPQTCSARIAADGYNAWNWFFGGGQVPEIDLNAVETMLDSDKRLVTAQRVPFAWAGNGKNIAFTSQWDNWPRLVTVPVNESGAAVWFLVCGSTNPMQCRIANAELRLRYADGEVEKLELVPPLNFWTLASLRGADYNYDRDAFCLPKTPPPTVQLGGNCRAVLLNQRLRPVVKLESITLETLSQEVVIGLMGVTVMK